MEPHHWTLVQAREAVLTHRISAQELTDHFLKRIERFNPSLAAYIVVNSEGGRTQAQAFDAMLQARFETPQRLVGLPLAVKDLFDTEDLRTTYGGKHFTNYIPPKTATAVRRLECAGGIVLGKTNLHEYAYGTTSENPHFGNVRNPWNRTKISGGSSGGTSAAIVAGLALGGLGTDTGGSVRIPAALTGHVGLKPTYGLVSKFGVFPLATSLDHVGPMAKTVQDVSLLLDLLAGCDVRDPDSIRIPTRSYFVDSARDDLAGVRFGVPRHFFFEKCHPNVLQAVQRTLQDIERRGGHLVEVELPHADEVPDAQGAIISSEATEAHRDLLKHADVYGADVRRRLESGRNVLAQDLIHAYRIREMFRKDSLDCFSASCDVIVCPTTPLTATDIGQFKTHIRAHEVNVRGHLTRYTNPWNLTGLPAISIPCGLAADGLPVGLQLIGPAFSERRLLAIAASVEAGIEWVSVAPEFS